MKTPRKSFNLTTLLIISASAAFSQSGSVSGVVQLDNSSVAANAYVSLRGNPQAGVIVPPYNADVVADGQGNYQFTAVPDGSYRVCVQLAGTPYLDPCTWSATPPTASVLNGSAVQMPVIQLQQGTGLNVYFNDPGGVLSSSATKNAGAAFFVGVWKTKDGIFIPMTSKPGNIYNLSVPPGASIFLSASTNFTSLTAGSSIQGAVHGASNGVESVTVPLTVPSGGFTAPFTINVGATVATGP